MARSHFDYAVELPGLDGEISGSYVADCGEVDVIYLPDGTEVAMDSRGVALKGDPVVRALAGAVHEHIRTHHLDWLDSTKDHFNWRSHAPIVI